MVIVAERPGSGAAAPHATSNRGEPNRRSRHLEPMLGPAQAPALQNEAAAHDGESYGFGSTYQQRIFVNKSHYA